MITIWHNPRCAKSRETLALLEATGKPVTVRLYLQDPPSGAEILAALKALGLPASQLVRKTEQVFREIGLDGAEETPMVAAMIDHPILIERPIVFYNAKAAIGRPPASALVSLGL